MARLGIGARPLVIIDGRQFVDDALWQIMNHESVCYSTSDPFVTLRYLPKPAPDRSNGYNPPNIADTSNTVPAIPIGDYLPDTCWIFIRLKPGYHGYGNTEDYFGALFVQDGKCLSLKFEMVGGMPTMRGYRVVSGGFSIGSDFLPGALTVVAIMAAAGAIGTALGAPPTLPGAGVGAPGAVLAPATVADIAPFVGPIEVAATTTPGWTLAETVGAAKAVGASTMEGVKVLNQVAGAVGAVAAVSAAIQGPADGSAPAPAPAPPPDSVGEKFGAVFDDLKTQMSRVDKKTWYMVGVVVLLSLG
ncbi:MAG: hypothetical protein WAZ38_03265 [Prolixibacteraceae bacterium]